MPVLRFELLQLASEIVGAPQRRQHRPLRNPVGATRELQERDALSLDPATDRAVAHPQQRSCLGNRQQYRLRSNGGHQRLQSKSRRVIIGQLQPHLTSTDRIGQIWTECDSATGARRGQLSACGSRTYATVTSPARSRRPATPAGYAAATLLATSKSSSGTARGSHHVNETGRSPR